MAESLVSGRTEYCYLQEDEHNVYKFSISATIPKTTRYSTISQHGILRFNEGECEQIDFADFMREFSMYTKLREIGVFKLFRQKKQFLLWKSYIKRRKFHHNVSFVFSINYFKIFMLDIFNVHLPSIL